MAKKEKSLGYYDDRTRLKWSIISVAVLISIGTIIYTNYLVGQLSERERQQIELFAKTLEYTINETSGSNIYFITDKILFENKSIPTILTDNRGNITDFRNIKIDSTKLTIDQVQARLYKRLKEMRESYPPIPVTVDDGYGHNIIYGYVNYNDSFLLVQLTYYPYVQLSIIAIIGFIAYLAVNYSRMAEQNKVWVGLAKETAHQLGTPISSLMAWLEILKEMPEIREQKIDYELNKDIKRLQLITERFSNIGSVPTLKVENMNLLINNALMYLRPRISSKVELKVHAITDNILAYVNPSLFEWVLENLIKNAVDAMGGIGKIDIHLLRGSENRVIIDIVDNGKGISKQNINKVFQPGFTTKQRGWGLGLALAKRIIDHYHFGRIYVKISEENVGTTFRISLRSATENQV